MGLIYLASPYNHENAEVREQRFCEAARAAGFLMQEGYVVYSPIVHNHTIAVSHGVPTGWDYWQKFDSVMLKLCSEVVILTIDGWQESKGIAAELEIAANLSLPIRKLTMVGNGYKLESHQPPPNKSLQPDRLQLRSQAHSASGGG